MPVQTEARDEALRRAREGARVVLAKHPCVVAGVARCGERCDGQAGARPGSVEIRMQAALGPKR